MATRRVPTQSTLGLTADPAFREVQSWAIQALNDLERIGGSVGNSKTDSNSALSSLRGQVKEIAEAQILLGTQQDQIEAQNAYLTSLATVASDTDSTGATGFTGFYGGTRPAVTISTPTGKFDINFGGSLNSGNGYFVYSIVDTATSTIYVDRATMQVDPSRRVAITGGASFAPSGYRSAIQDGLPIDVNLLVTLEYYAATTTVYILGGSIVVRPAP